MKNLLLRVMVILCLTSALVLSPAVPVLACDPSTILSVEVSATGVPGDPVVLTITETNNGDANLYYLYIAIEYNGITDTYDRFNHYQSGDNSALYLMQAGETWTWVVTYYPLVTTTYTITGHGFLCIGVDSNGNAIPGEDITYPAYPDEQKIVTVTIEDVQECAECDGKVTQLTLRYNGSVEDAEIRVEQKGKNGGVVFDGIVQPGNEFTFSGIDKKGTLGTEISIYVGGTLNTEIHTSCSQPIGPGLFSGDFEVVEGYSRNGGLLCPIPPVEDECGECEGGVTELTLKYLAGPDDPATDHIVVTDKKGNNVLFDGNLSKGEMFHFVGQDKKGKLGSEIKILVGIDETKIHTSCSQLIGIGSVFGDFEVIDGASLKGGKLCPVSDEGCGECEGGVTELTLKYLAGPDSPDTDHIVVTDKKGKNVLFEGDVSKGETFSFVGQDKNGKLGSEIKILVGIDDDINETKIHTSCSQPIGIGSVFGDFEVIDGASLKGGSFCP